MHELSVTENILKTSLEYADREHAVKVTAINLNIGQLSSIVDDSVQFYWEFDRKRYNLRAGSAEFQPYTC